MKYGIKTKRLCLKTIGEWLGIVQTFIGSVLSETIAQHVNG